MTRIGIRLQNSQDWSERVTSDRMVPSSHELRQELERRLAGLPEVTIGPWKDTDLICVSYKGVEFGHFHGQTVLDVRLSPKIIRQEGLSRDVTAEIHPDRSQNSRWICLECKSRPDIDQLVKIAGLACGLIA